MRGDRVEIVIDAGSGTTRTYDVSRRRVRAARSPSRTGAGSSRSRRSRAAAAPCAPRGSSPTASSRSSSTRRPTTRWPTRSPPPSARPDAGHTGERCRAPTYPRNGNPAARRNRTGRPRRRPRRGPAADGCRRAGPATSRPSRRPRGSRRTPVRCRRPGDGARSPEADRARAPCRGGRPVRLRTPGRPDPVDRAWNRPVADGAARAPGRAARRSDARAAAPTAAARTTTAPPPRSPTPPARSPRSPTASPRSPSPTSTASPAASPPPPAPATGEPRAKALAAVSAALDTAEPASAARRAAVPAISYPPELPVSARRADIAAAIRDHQVVIVAGETGSGKTTQIPKICLELGRGVRGMIGHTQPRRLAARTVAARIAEELHTDVGDAVGWKVRFTDQVGDNTLVKLMTDGILLAELAGDRMLRGYDTLIIDEAHERSLNVDFILGYLAQLLPRRPDLKVVITSATIDPERFAKHFGGAPIVEVSGRSYPVEIRYRPIVDPEDPDADPDRDQLDAIADAVTELRRAGPGDILVFLPGEREIRDTADAPGPPLRRDRHGDPPPLRPPDHGRAAARVRAAAGHAGPPGRARDQRRRDLADGPRHPLRDRPRPRAHLPLLAAPEGPAAADREDQPGQREPAGRAAAAASPTASASASTPRTTSTPAPPSPTRRSCAPTSPGSSCR